jgi:hypothetical protein
MVDEYSVFPPELRQWMKGGKRYKEGWLEGRRAAANYSPSLVSRVGRALTRREREGFIGIGDVVLNLNRYFRYKDPDQRCAEHTKRKLLSYFNFLERELSSGFHSDPKTFFRPHGGGLLELDTTNLVIEGIGFINYFNNRGDSSVVRIVPFEDREIAVYQTLTGTRKLTGAGIIYHDDGVLKRHVVF